MCFRCVKGEGEIEKLQAKVVELRRKLDDTTAAMQELGRENQSLQVSRKTSGVIIFTKMSGSDVQRLSIVSLL